MSGKEGENPFRFLRFSRNNPPPAQHAKPEKLHGPIIHKVVSGDTVSIIAEKYHQDPQVILEANDIPHADNLAIGQLIVVPLTYKIKKGDTLYSLSKKFGVSMATLQAANGIKDPNKIYEGDVIVVPQEAEISGMGMLT